MFEKPKALQAIGLEIDGSFLKGVQISISKGHPTIDRLFKIEIQNDNFESEYSAQNEIELLSDLSKKLLTATTLTTQEVLIRPIEIKLKKERDIDSVFSFQVEPLLPYSIDNAILDRIRLSEVPDGTQFTLCAARKDYIQSHLNKWEQLQIEPEVVSCEPLALALFSKFFVGLASHHFVVHLGDNHTSVVLVQEGKPLAAQSSDYGLNMLEEAFSHDSEDSFSALDFATIKKETTPRLYAAVEHWRMEIIRLLYALGKLSKDQEALEVLVTGEGAALLNLPKLLLETSNKQLLAPAQASSSQIDPVHLQQNAVSIGSALSVLTVSKEQVNFRQQEFSYPNPWKRVKKPLAIYAGLTVLFAGAIFIFGEAYLTHKEDAIRQEYVALLSAMNKTYNGFETEFTSKNISKNSNNEETISPAEALTTDDISLRLNELRKELKDDPDLFPLQPNVPRVSDVLAWLSTHPNVVTKDGSFQIENFNYSLVKRPELKKKQEKYQVKVEFEFSAPTPKQAREFHDALIAPNEIVDAKSEVKWSSNRGKYRTSFYLKDKTSYPSATRFEG